MADKLNMGKCTICRDLLTSVSAGGLTVWERLRLYLMKSSAGVIILLWTRLPVDPDRSSQPNG